MPTDKGSRFWQQRRDGDPAAMALFSRHYTYRRSLKRRLAGNRIVGPGQYMLLLTPDHLAMFVWRKFESMDHQRGVNCAVFRNEGSTLSSDLILDAERLAWARWPGERLYTYVNSRKIRSSNPGCCFLAAGWRKCGRTKSRGLLILEKLP